jgi:hypothetical protein
LQTDRLVRAIGGWSLAGLMLNTIVGSAIFGLPALIAAQLGAWSPFGFVIAALGVAAIAACLAEVASQFTQTGGPYLYAREAFGRFVAIQIGWLTWLSRIAAAAAGANLFIAYLAAFAPVVQSSASMRAAIMAALIGCVAVLTYRGVAAGIRLSNLFTIAKLAVMPDFRRRTEVYDHAEESARRPHGRIPRLRREHPAERSLRRREPVGAHPHRVNRPHAERKDVGHRRPVRRNEGATRRLLRD